LWLQKVQFSELTFVLKSPPIANLQNVPRNGVYLVVIKGKVEVNGQTLHTRDAMGISDMLSFDVTAIEDAELLAIEVPMG
jgi:quercetin 2,3-dioxygenase